MPGKKLLKKKGGKKKKAKIKYPETKLEG